MEILQSMEATVSSDLERFWPKVQKTETCWIWLACKNETGYGWFTANKKRIKAHRYAYSEFVGAIPEGMNVDHLCNNRCCVNPAHLRLATRGQNAKNRRLDSRSSSGLKGAVWNAKAKRWQSRILCDGKFHYLGTFKTAEEAHAAYCEAAVRLHGEFANLG